MQCDQHLFSSLVSYRMRDVDPGCEHDERDDGEAVLGKVRSVLPTIANASSPAGVAKMVLGASLACNPSHVAWAEECLFSPTSRCKPRAYLVHPTAMEVEAEAVDRCVDEWQRRHRVVALSEGDTCAVLLHDRTSRQVAMREVANEDTCVVVRFDTEEAKRAPFFPSRAPTLEIRREGPGTGKEGDEDELVCELLCFDGTRKEFRRKVSASVCASLFRPSHLFRLRQALVPSKLSERRLPTPLQIDVASFWRDRMRAHVLVRASQPAYCASDRQLCFASMSVASGLRKQQGGVPMTSVTATLHASSAKCLCAAHGLTPVERRFPNLSFTDSKVRFTMSICGRTIARMPGAQGQGICPVCVDRTKTVDGVTCCNNLSVDVACHHFADGGKTCKQGVGIFGVPIDDEKARDEARSAVSACIRHSKSIHAPARAKGEDDACSSYSYSDATSYAPSVASSSSSSTPPSPTPPFGSQTSSSSSSSSSSSGKRKRPSADEDATPDDRLDANAVRLLRSKRTKQMWKKSIRKTVLIQEHASQTGRYSFLKGDNDALNERHRWLFPKQVPFR